MDVPELIVTLITGLPNLAGLSILSYVLHQQNARLMDSQDRTIQSLTNDVGQIRHDVKRIKDKMNIAE